MERRFIVLVVWCHIVGGKEGESGRNVRACSSGKPIDGADNALVDLRATFQIWIFGIRMRNGVYGVTRSVGRHVGDKVHPVDAKPVGCEFSESRLREMDREVAVVVVLPRERSAQEVINLAHEVHFNFGRKDVLKESFFIVAGGIENEVINI